MSTARQRAVGAAHAAPAALVGAVQVQVAEHGGLRVIEVLAAIEDDLRAARHRAGGEACVAASAGRRAVVLHLRCGGSLEGTRADGGATAGAERPAHRHRGGFRILQRQPR